MYVRSQANHTGRTGPCSTRRRRAGYPTELYYAYSDDAENAAGGAAYHLRGVCVHAMEEFANVSYLNERWFIAAASAALSSPQRAPPPWVYCGSLTARAEWITGPAARITMGTLIASPLRRRHDRHPNNSHGRPTLDARDANGGNASSSRCAGYRQKPDCREICRVRSPTHERGGGPAELLQVASPRSSRTLDELYAHRMRHLMIEGRPRHGRPLRR